MKVQKLEGSELADGLSLGQSLALNRRQSDDLLGSQPIVLSPKVKQMMLEQPKADKPGSLCGLDESNRSLQSISKKESFNPFLNPSEIPSNLPSLLKSRSLMVCVYCNAIQSVRQTTRAFYAHIRACKAKHDKH